MKKIIDGKRYDTETATFVASASANCSTSDFGWWEESLFVTKKGAWFTHGKGGPMTSYGVTEYGSTHGSEDIRPKIKDEAKSWLEKHDFVGSLEEYFGSELEDA
jgi:hypothetical protein